MGVVRLPEGVECDLVLYLTDDAGLEVKIRVRGLPAFPTSFNETIDHGAMLARLDIDLPPGKWRAMTRAEIKDYRSREDDE